MHRKFWTVVVLWILLTLSACVAPAAAPASPAAEEAAAAEVAGPPSTPTGTLIVALPLDPNSINPPNAAERVSVRKSSSPRAPAA